MACGHAALGHWWQGGGAGSNPASGHWWQCHWWQGGSVDSNPVGGTTLEARKCRLAPATRRKARAIIRTLRALLTSTAALLLAWSLATAPAVASQAPEGQVAAQGASKLLVFVVENHSLSQMRQQMPWTSRLANTYGYATHYRAMSHPSLPNYLAIAGGSTFGIRDDSPPPSHPLKGHSVFGAARKAGLSAHVYAEGMPSNCALASRGDYAVRHNPWTYFPRDRRGCRASDTSLGRFGRNVRRGHLPRAGMVVPNLCHDAHDCALATADAWLKNEVGRAMSGPDYSSGRLAIVITADENDGSRGNRVLTVVVHPSVQGVVTSAPLTHLSLCRLYTQVLGLPALRHARNAYSMSKAFGLAIQH